MGHKYISRRILALIAALALAAIAAAQPAGAHLYPIREGRKWGFIDAGGKVVIKPQYDKVEEFSEDLAQFWSGAKTGYIDRQGRPVIEAQYATGTPFEMGHAIVTFDGLKYLAIDKTGAVRTEIPYRLLGDFHAGLARVQRVRTKDAEGKTIPTAYGYINRLGKVIIEPQFITASHFPDDGEGLAVGILNHEWCYFDRTGRVLVRLPVAGHDRADPYRDGLLRFKEGFYWGYKDTSGAWAIEPKFDAADDFEDGVASVESKGKRVFIDRKGRTVELPKGPRRIGPPSDGLTRVREGDRLGYIGSDAKLAFVLRKYDEAHDFNCGRARIKLDGQYGYLSRTGELAIPNQFTSATDFRFCRAQVMTREGWSYIDPDGKVIWTSKF